MRRSLKFLASRPPRPVTTLVPQKVDLHSKPLLVWGFETSPLRWRWSGFGCLNVPSTLKNPQQRQEQQKAEKRQTTG